MRHLSDERHQNLEAVARCYSNMARRALLSVLAEHSSVTLPDVQREFPALSEKQLRHDIQPLLKAGLMKGTSRAVRGRSQSYSFTSTGIQALRDLHEELSTLIAALEAPDDKAHE